MAMRSLFLLLFITSLIASPGLARDLTPAEKAADLEALITTVRAGYGPLQYKATWGIDLEQLRTEYLERARATRTNGEYYYTVLQFIARFQDSHFGGQIPTTRSSSLPFLADWVNGQVLIDTINRKSATPAQFPFERGDIILEMDGKPIDAVVAELAKNGGSGYSLTAQRRATMRLAARNGAVLPPFSGTSTLKIQHAKTGQVEMVTLKWENRGTGFDEIAKSSRRAQPRVSPREKYDLLSTRDLWNEFRPFETEQSFRCSGTTRIAIPEDATVILEEPFVAYYHPTPYGNVGYLRIPHYYPENEQTGEMEYELRFKQYEYAVSILNKNTVGLIIDQDHNCGGSVDYLHRIVSLFMDRPFAPMQFELLANKETVLDFDKTVKELDPNTIEYAETKSVLDLVLASWQGGSFLTPKTALDGQPLIHPNPVRYKHPIVILIDEMSGSGGDAFPALMQGYGRAKLVGTRTMGAGGHVEEIPALPFSRIKINMTKSLFYRPDGIPVENNGAAPDHPYTITSDDFVGGYRGYHAFALSRLYALIAQ